MKHFFRSVCFSLLVLLFPVQLKQSSGAYAQPIPGSDLSIDFVAIPGGNFVMGSPEAEAGRNADETQHSVEVSPFWMSTLEVTWDQFELFLYRETDAAFNTENREIDLAVDGIAGATMPYVNFNKPGYPLINVTQYAASTFCKWLSAKTGHFYRLPTEAEWEYASRAGNESAFSFDHSDLEKHAWFKGNSSDQLQKGGKKEPNAWGLYDMHGNAAEWVIDGYDSDFYQQSNGAENPVFFPEQLYPRVVRGGSFKDDKDQLRAAARAHSSKSWKRRDPQIPKSLWWLTDAQHVGFRVVRPAQAPPKDQWDKYWGTPIKEY